MYCPECGTKNEKNAKFCENCGEKLETVQKETNKAAPKQKVAKQKKPMSKKSKIIIIVVIVIAAALVIGINSLKNSIDPKSIAKSYYEAYIHQNVDKMYTYCDLSAGGAFTDKKAFKTFYSSSDKVTDAKNIQNYNITGIDYDKSGLTAKVSITYTTNNSSISQKTTITLQKSSDKKYFFFDDWKVSLSSDDLVTNYSINVPKNATISINGTKLKDTYKEKTSSNTSYDVYKVPMMFKTDYQATVQLSNGFEIEETFKPSSYYSSTTISLTAKNIKDSDKEILTNQVQEDINTLYESAIADKEWKEISTKFASDNSDLEELYNSLAKRVDGGFFSNKISSFKVTAATIRNISTNSDGSLEVSVKLNYTYKTIDSEDKEEEKEDSTTTYLEYNTDNKDLVLVDASSLPSYF